MGTILIDFLLQNTENMIEASYVFRAFSAKQLNNTTCKAVNVIQMQISIIPLGDSKEWFIDTLFNNISLEKTAQ